MRLAQPLHREFDVLRLNLSPAIDLGLVPVFRESLKIFAGQLSRKGKVACELFSDVGIAWHCGSLAPPRARQQVAGTEPPPDRNNAPAALPRGRQAPLNRRSTQHPLQGDEAREDEGDNSNEGNGTVNVSYVRRHCFGTSEAFVGVVSGVCVPPDFGMTVSFKVVFGMLGLFSPTV